MSSKIGPLLLKSL